MTKKLGDVVTEWEKEPGTFHKWMAFYKANPNAAVSQLGLVLTAAIFTTSVVGLVDARESQKAGRELARHMLEASTKQQTPLI